MRLLHTKDLEFQEFYDKQIPKYVILSHRWIGNEVTYAEFYDPKARERPEFAKIKNCCSFAENHGFEWVGDIGCSLPDSPFPLTWRGLMYYGYPNQLNTSATVAALTLKPSTGLDRYLLHR